MLLGNILRQYMEVKGSGHRVDELEFDFDTDVCSLLLLRQVTFRFHFLICNIRLITELLSVIMRITRDRSYKNIAIMLGM